VEENANSWPVSQERRPSAGLQRCPPKAGQSSSGTLLAIASSCCCRTQSRL
jgi:hypothetical protein